MTDDVIAWAAGLFDGEGSSSMYLPKKRKTARRQIQVSQASDMGHPVVLDEFREIVGVGNVTGPYRDSLYYWKTTRKDAIDQVALTLWPYLSLMKRDQFSAMTVKAGRELPTLPESVRAASSEIAWAAGLFDGEGSAWLVKDPERPEWRSVALEVPQSSADGVPDVLLRFQLAVGAGAISGPRKQSNPWSRLPQYRWQLSGRHNVSAVVRTLWPHLRPVNRTRFLALRTGLDPELASIFDAP